MFTGMKEELNTVLDNLRRQGLYKEERIIASPQGARIDLPAGRGMLNLCANNYLGLSSDPRVVRAAQEAMENWGYGLSSVRFICGTQQIHRQLEEMVSRFLKTEDTLLYASCFDANAGVFEPLLDDRDAIISDELNHASIIDGVRLCKAKRFRYRHSNTTELEQCLLQSRESRYRLICTDGVFSMDGDIARLSDICTLADRHDAMVMVDDSHGTGYIGPTGRGTPEHCGVEGRIDIITTTFGKALGGASGGCVSGRKEIIEVLRQRSRPYLFSNSLPPAIVGATMKVLDILQESSEFREQILEKTEYFKRHIRGAGFEVVPGETAIVPIMLHGEVLAHKMADMLLEEGVYVVGFVFPVVPKGKARIRVQVSAAHSYEDLDIAVDAFTRVGRRLNVIPSV